ncbi:MAG TPA: sulfate ABC transporter substrate-binding protein, partial [Steroidobacteraceae bacterium]|nr:sulfate ABC transporter substrate-binding protein [Steroidobacteraceae bacterium]
GSTTTFVLRELGDVLLAWENEALLAIRELGAGRLEIVVPSLSILAEPPVAVVAGVARRHGTEPLARAYLEYLYGAEGQEIAARNFYRPRERSVAARYAARFPALRLVTIADFGGWPQAQRTHFGEGGVFDSIYAP